MTSPFNSLAAWIAEEAVGFDPADNSSAHAAIDRLIGALPPEVRLLGFGEPMHGAEEILLLRNQLLQRLVTAHGYVAIAVESSCTRGKVVNQFVAGNGTDDYDAILAAGFSHGFGALAANRELILWLREYNAQVEPQRQVRFFGFDSPTEMVGTDSPRQTLFFALDYLAAIDGDRQLARRQRIDSLLGENATWEEPGASFDPTKSIGDSPDARALRIETEELLAELQVRRPELIAASGKDCYLEALQDARIARQLLNYHACLARAAESRIADLLGLRDAMMADNLVSIVARERPRGKVFAFAHNSHLQLGVARWQWGPNALQWWPAGAHARDMLGYAYAVIGTGVGSSEQNGIAAPEDSSLEALLLTATGPGRFVPTHLGERLSSSEVNAVPVRSGGKNPTYFPLTKESLTNFDWLAVLDRVTYNRGGPPLPP